MRIRYLLVILVVLVAMDGLVTQFLITNKLSWELNPILSPLAGKAIFIPLKVAGGLMSALLFWDIHKRSPRLAMIATSSFVVIYSAIVFWNIASYLVSRAYA